MSRSYLLFPFPQHWQAPSGGVRPVRPHPTTASLSLLAVPPLPCRGWHTPPARSCHMRVQNGAFCTRTGFRTTVRVQNGVFCTRNPVQGVCFSGQGHRLSDGRDSASGLRGGEIEPYKGIHRGSDALRYDAGTRSGYGMHLRLLRTRITSGCPAWRKDRCRASDHH